MLVVALLLAFNAVAQSDATKGLSGPTLRLFKAVELNDIGAAKGSLDDGADLSKQNEDGMTAADLAVDMGHFIIAHYLLSRKLLGETTPVMLSPGPAIGPAADVAKPTAAVTPKPTFARPPAKPAPPSPAVAAKPDAPKPTVAEMPAAPSAEPSPAPATPPTTETLTEVPPASPGPATTETLTEVPPAAVAESPPAEGLPADKPLGDIGVARFFKSLVDLITPGGEKPAEMAAAKPATGKPAPPATPEAMATPSEKPADTPPAKGPEEIVVDITGDGKPTGERIKEIEQPPLPKLAEKDLETLTADTPTAKPDAEKAADKPKAAAAPKDEAMPMPAATKPDKREPSALDRLADLMKPDQKSPAPAETPMSPPPRTPAAPAPGPAATPVLPGAPPGAPPGKPDGAPGTVTAYQLPLPTAQPTAPTKFSPRFLDKLADFLESGDEAAFKAWLPEMQIMGAAVPQSRPPATAVATAVDQTTPAPPMESATAVDTTQPPAAAKGATAPAAAPELSATDAVEADLAGIAGEAPTPSIAVAERAPTTPGAQPDAAAGKPGMIRGAFNKLLGVLTPTGRDMERSERLVLEPEEKLAAVDKGARPAGSAPAQKVWPVTEVEAAKTAPIAMTRPVSDVLLKTSLTGVTLSLGESVSLENSFPPSQDGTDPQNQCVKKNRGTTLFCLEPIDWPDRVQADFLVPTILYTGHKAIARYDQGIASRFHALFPATAFERVIGYFRERFGEPTDHWNRSIAPFAEPRQDNPTLAWRSVDPKTGAISVLEIRKYDDTRGGFPDTNRGAVMLYLANSPPIFPQVSSHELMRLSRTPMGPPTGESPTALPVPPGAAAAPEAFPLPDPGAQPDLALPEPGASPDAAVPGAEVVTPGETQPGTEGKTEKQLKDEERAKRRAEREAKRAAGAAKQAAGQAKQEIGAKRTTKPATGTAPKTPDQSLDLPPNPLKQ